MAKKTIYQKIEQIAINNDGTWKVSARKAREESDWIVKSKKIAIRVLRTLKEKGLQQKELASLLKVTPQQVSKILKGNVNLTLETITKLEKALDIPLMDIPKRQKEIPVFMTERSVGVFMENKTRVEKTIKWKKAEHQVWQQPFNHMKTNPVYEC